MARRKDRPIAPSRLQELKQPSVSACFLLYPTSRRPTTTILPFALSTSLLLCRIVFSLSRSPQNTASRCNWPIISSSIQFSLSRSRALQWSKREIPLPARRYCRSTGQQSTEALRKINQTKKERVRKETRGVSCEAKKDEHGLSEFRLRARDSRKFRGYVASSYPVPVLYDGKDVCLGTGIERSGRLVQVPVRIVKRVPIFVVDKLAALVIVTLDRPDRAIPRRVRSAGWSV